MQNLQSHQAGTQVEARGESWIVLRAEPYDACTIVTLRGIGDTNLGRTTELIAPFDRLNTTPASVRVRRAPRRAVLRAAAAAVARAHAWLEPWSAATANIDLLPWQLEPAMAAVGGAMRLLLADGVGLGKTVQAGLILAELRARGLARRALVLTPASLREQWAAELRERFALDPVVLDHAALLRLAGELPPDVNPWSVADIAISSIDLVKRGEVRRALDAIALDVLVVDEAHHLRPGTDRGALVEDLAARVPWVVLVTATPHSGDEPAYAFLRGLGAHDRDDGAVTFRRTGAVAGRENRRRVIFHAVRATEAEQILLDATVAYARAIWTAHKALVAAVICRRAVSSAAALLRTLTRRRELLAATTGQPAAAQTELPWQENDERDAVESDHLLEGPRLRDTHVEIEWLDRLISHAEAAVVRSSKAAAIRRLLARTTETAIVFSEYRDTLVFLQERLSEVATVATIHGGMTARERREAVRQFAGGGARVLLATDAAGEGLNLQERCRLVINVELPWNPLRLEQRIGRVDRLGQVRRSHAIQLVHRGSFEDLVLARFERRLRDASRDLADERVDEEAVAAAVLDGAEITRRAQPQAAPHINAGRCETAAMRRRAVKALGSGSRAGGTLVATPSARCVLTHGVAALFECDIHDRRGRLVSREVLTLLLDLERGVVLHRRDAGLLAHAIQSSAAVRRAVDAFVSDRGAVAARDAGGAGSAISRRLQQILAATPASSRTPLQVSLFDRRAEQQARADAAAAQAVRDHVNRRLDAARALTDVSCAAARLVALWPIAAR